jgi:hypothetical protein
VAPPVTVVALEAGAPGHEVIPGASESWGAVVQASLVQGEYEPSTTREGILQAPNRAHDLRTTFDERGIAVGPRTKQDTSPAWRFAWQTTGFGRPGRIEEVAPSSPSAAGARVVYQRDGWSEWYENSAKGLEQGFTVEQRPAGEGALQIIGGFSEGLRPELRADGAIDFIDDHGACVIRYGEPHTWDARGVELPSELVVAGSELAILVEDGGAAYPITVDPLMTSPAWTAESDQASALFGQSVATAGDVNGDGFSDVIVGAIWFDNGQSDEGRAFVYHGSMAGLAITPAWTAESDQAGAFFGRSVATAGDVNGDGFSDVIVGAYFYGNGQSGEGRAFVYLGSAGGVSTTAAWTAESDQADTRFGQSVATAGDVNGDGYSDVIVGAPNYDNGQADEGRASIYHGSASGLSTTAAWTAESDQASASFGVSTATAGDVNGDGFADVIVGAWQYDNGQTDEGRASVYQGSATGLGSIAAWNAESDQAGAQFGGSAATAGDVNGDGFSDVIVGAVVYDNGQTDEGRAFVYQGSAASLSTTAAWTAESNQAFAQFGYSVSTAGDVNGDGYSDVLVGAWQYDNGETNEGQAYLYMGSEGGLTTSAAWTGESNQDGGQFGVSVATAGDVNGDGFSDVIVGALGYDNLQTDEGRAYVYLGSGAGLSSTAAWTAESDQAGAFFGASVATAGDVNGDGYSDVMVGAYAYDNGQFDEGRAFVYHGSATGLSPTADWTAESDQFIAGYGLSVATAGDVNGDALSDVIVGAWRYDNGPAGEGRAYVYHGSAGGLSTNAAWTAEGNQPAANFGVSVATAGDVNGDGFSDVIVGAYGYQSGEGRAFVYHGSAAGLLTFADWSRSSEQPAARFGISVSTAGDVNGDGFSDVIVGAYGYDNDQDEEGRAFVYHGTAAGLFIFHAWTAEGDQQVSLFGSSVATAGDVNGDGYADAIVGAWSYGNGQGDEGRAFVYYGNGGLCRTTQLRQQRTDGTTPVALLGRSDSDTQFRIRAIMPSIYGRTRVQMEHEVKPLGALFDGLGTVTGDYLDVGDDGEVEMDRLVGALSADTPYHWRVRAKYDLTKTPFQRNGPWMHVPVNGWNEADLRTAEATTGIEAAEAPGVPLLLEAPLPNPFGTTAAIGYTLPLSGRVRLAVYDVTGRERVVLVDAVEPAGRQVAIWNGRGGRGTQLPAGVYFVRLAFGGHVETQKLVLAP